MSQDHSRRTLLAYAAATAAVLASSRPSVTRAQEKRKAEMTSKPPTELQTLNHTHINSFNTQNLEGFP
jgi:hypothetical protein